MADIAQLGVGGSGIDSLERWALAQFSPPARNQRRQRKEQVQEELSQLLFGVDLSPGDLQVYKARLLEAIARVDGLEQGRILTLDGDIAVPRSKMNVNMK